MKDNQLNEQQDYRARAGGDDNGGPERSSGIEGFIAENRKPRNAEESEGEFP